MIQLISIAHRLQTVAYYDRILVIDAGQVAEVSLARLQLHCAKGSTTPLLDSSILVGPSSVVSVAKRYGEQTEWSMLMGRIYIGRIFCVFKPMLPLPARNQTDCVTVADHSLTCTGFRLMCFRAFFTVSFLGDESVYGKR